MTSIDDALEVCVKAFALHRSRTWPYLAEFVEGIWRLYDAPRSGVQRNDEYVAHGVPPAEVDRIARGRSPGRYHVCAVATAEQPDGPFRVVYRALGYRLGHTEPMFLHSLSEIPGSGAPFPVHRVTTSQQAEVLGKAMGRRPLAESQFWPEGPVRQYMAADGGQPVGWVRSIAACDAAYVADLYVKPEYRRQGIGRALMSAMLRGDRESGARYSVLLASHTGAMLYPTVGYEQIGMWHVYTPKRE